MPYFGASSENAVRRRFTYLASASATSISGADVNGQVLAFQDGSYVDVYLNGVKLKTGEDYDTATANTINNLSALNLNDEVEIIVYELFNVADTVSKTDGGTFNSAISVTGNVTSTGNLIINDGGNIGSTSDTDAISISSTGVTTFSQRDIHSGGITIADGGTIGSASDADAITIASAGGVTFAEVANVDKGIKFPATQVASTNANTLDDYEEGTYTPVVTINASSTGIVLSNALGFYNKIGRQCNITNRITLTNKGSSTGIFAVSLPFTASSNSIQGGALLYYGVNFSTLSANAIYAVATADAATYNLATSAGGTLVGNGGGQSDQIANNTDFIVTFTYLTT